MTSSRHITAAPRKRMHPTTRAGQPETTGHTAPASLPADGQRLRVDVEAQSRPLAVSPYLMSTLLASQWLSMSSMVIATLLRSMRGWGLTTLLID
jgi:hypothetical protein